MNIQVCANCGGVGNVDVGDPAKPTLLDKALLELAKLRKEVKRQEDVIERYRMAAGAGR